MKSIAVLLSFLLARWIWLRVAASFFLVVVLMGGWSFVEAAGLAEADLHGALPCRYRRERNQSLSHRRLGRAVASDV
jgi:hypothetical protein